MRVTGYSVQSKQEHKQNSAARFFLKVIEYNSVIVEIRGSGAVYVCHFFLASNDSTGICPT